MVSYSNKVIGSMAQVYNPKHRATHTKGGLQKKDLTTSKSSGLVVSKKKQAAGHRLAKKFPPQLTQAARFTGRRR
jgi:hypothetical protein